MIPNRAPSLSISVIVPCYNEEDNIAELYRRLHQVCKSYDHLGYEIVLVNDGSKDSTWSKIQQLSQTDPHIVGVCLSRNFGHSMALTAGLDVCRGERIFIIDADLQDPPELLPDMLALMSKGADVVYGRRLRREGETFFKRISASIFYRLINLLSDTTMPKDTGDFRLINRRVLEALKSMPETSRYTRGMIAWVGFTQVPIKYERSARFAGKTNYTLRKMIDFAVSAITGFSIRPLRIAFYLGIIMFLSSFGLLAYILYSYFTGSAVQGWASLAFIIVTLQSIQFMLLGLMGEYIGRIYQESKHRPKYVISESVGLE